MQLKYQKNLVNYQPGFNKVQAIAWAPNNSKLAICNSDNVIILFDGNGEKKDKFSTKPADSKTGKKGFVVRGLAFSPDSTKLAVGQSDCIIFVYKIGEGWNEKKVICNKFVQQSQVTCMTWPSDQGIIFGLFDGKVRLANVKSNKSSTVYGTGNHVIAVASSPDKKSFLSAHADNSIVRFSFNTEESSGKICSHTCPAYALVWTANAVVAGGCDRRIISYSKDGRVLQQFDYSRDVNEKEFTTAAVSPSGQSVIFGSYDRLRTFDWNIKRGAWDEGSIVEIQYLYTITAVEWKHDGSKVVIGTLCGGVEMFDCALKKSKLSKHIEVTHVGPSQIIVRNTLTDESVTIRSDLGHDIEDVKVMGKDRYVVARSAETLLLGDIASDRFSEVYWQSGGNEKFYFENENVCFVFNAGELSLVEYGVNEILAHVRTDFMNPHLISVRINERKHEKKDGTDVKVLAFLLDVKTISIMDLVYGSMIATVNHDSKVDWLELNETGKMLLYRDKRYRWVPGSDVVVAQSRENLCVWYNVADADQMTMMPIKGDVIDVIREDDHTEVIVQEGSQEMGYPLDDTLIEFGTAMEDGDFGRAVSFLEGKKLTPAIEALWKQLANGSLEQRKLAFAERCYAALGDISRAVYLNETKEIAREAAKQIGGDGTQHYKVRARLAIMDRRFKEAERIYLEQDRIAEALEMYERLQKWDAALELAQDRSGADAESVRAKCYRFLAESGQDEKAGELREKEGDYLAAIDLYLKANTPSRAARLVNSRQELQSQTELVSSIANALLKSELYDSAGQLFEKQREFDKALDSYKKGKVYDKAVELARGSYPQEVRALEEEWGDYLSERHQTVNAINHYIESGNSVKALQASIKSREWDRAIDILKTIEEEDPEKAKEFYGKIAPHYADIQEYDRAERYYTEAGLFNEAVEMYNKAGRWEDAHRIASDFLEQNESAEMYLKQGKSLEDQGRYREAEKLYVAIKQPTLAVNMYKNTGQHDHMMRVVQQYFPDRAEDITLGVAKELEESGQYTEAEKYYLAAKEWKSVATMYRNSGQWENAHRIAKQYGGEAAAKQVAFYWAKSLGGESAVKLLQKFGVLEDAIDSSCENGAFEFAFELCRLGMKTKLRDVHLKYAIQLEKEGQVQEAEKNFINAGRAKDAVMMYIQREDYDNAQKVAEKHAPDEAISIYIGQGEAAFRKKDYAKAEAYYLRAKKPELIVDQYKDANMWQDALRVCKEYLPNLYRRLQNEFDQYNLMSGAKGAESFLAQGKKFEEQGEYIEAIEAYLKVGPHVTKDTDLIEQSWKKAGDISVKFVMEDKPSLGIQFIKDIASKFSDIGKHGMAGDLYLSGDLIQESVESYIQGNEWNKAQKVASEMEPSLVSYVDDQYKAYLKNEGNTDQLASLDVIGAIDMLIEKGDWEKALDTAKQQKNGALLDKYVMAYSAEMITRGRIFEAIQAFTTYGASANEANFNMYQKLIEDVIGSPGLNSSEAYDKWSALRDMLLALVQNISHDSPNDDPWVNVFKKYMLISHLYAVRSAVQTDPSLSLLAAKICISLLRYTELIPADKAFYEAGMAAKQEGQQYEGMAFVFLNHYLDLADAIEDKSPESVDNSDFDGTDIPSEIPLPEKLHLTEDEHDEVKEWVLAVSVDKDINRDLIKDQRGVYEASLLNPDGSKAPFCLITGYPVLHGVMNFGSSEYKANKEDWNKFLVASKVAANKYFEDVLKFVGKLTDTPTAFA